MIQTPPPVLAALRPDQAMLGRFMDWLGGAAVNLVSAGLILAVTFWLASWLSGAVSRAVGRVHRRSPDPALQTFSASLVRYAIVLVGLVVVLQQLGIKATSILAVLGAASLAIGLALQGALSNVAAGAMILLFRPYRVGDFIETSTPPRQGTVKALDLLFTEIATPDNVKVLIPNSKVFGDVIVNYSAHRLRRVDVLFKVPLKTDLVVVLRRLRDRAEADPRVRREPAVLVEVTDLSESFAQAAIRVWTSLDDFAAVRTDLMLSAHLLAADPAADLAASQPSTTVDPSPTLPDFDGQALVRRKSSRSRKTAPPGSAERA